ncbi:prolipoprotein diacylglyceryl transferase family protein [Polyangium sp. 6x1]|uniref:prolipoprotein diacylglyceryl transferase family protein n=1 Tax=Polyangium sp. 6x1 TaxID=3042689 RepID=UPI0024828AF8|nr:prolipoprotein diacylglyceryl transferase family protein [Polyangium sp. 6x1]MDI1448259.1 prolipoprotein diacylglyceryl transferase [Polyangium sp. 6x1]
MRSLVVAWLERHGLPGWLAPDYMVMVGLASLLGAAVTQRLSRRDGADAGLEGRALIAAYAGALAGGYVFEWLRALPEALLSGSLDPLLHAGRAAYGGLLLGALAAAWVLRRGGAKALPFLDRAVPLCGISYGFVRTGCFLAGCDYGKPTAGLFGVRFPAESPAALDHASLGWIPQGAPSLPVHPTQLYEAAVGLVAAAIASLWLFGPRRDGRAFGTWIALYATGRFFVEMVRGDASRGTYGPLSSAQVVSIVLLVGVGAAVVLARRGPRLSLASAMLAAAALVVPEEAAAEPAKSGQAAQPAKPAQPAQPAKPAGQTTQAPAGQKPGAATPPSVPPPPPVQQAQPYPPPQGGAYPYPYPPPAQGAAPYPYPYPYPYPPPPQGAAPYPYPYPYPYPPPPQGATPQAGVKSVPADELPPEERLEDPQKDYNKRRFSIGLAGGGYFAPGRFAVKDGALVDLEATYRITTGPRQRFEIGLEGRFVGTTDAAQGGIGVPMRFVAGLGRYSEIEFTTIPFYSRVVFDSAYFEPANGFGARFQLGFGFPLTSHFAIGFTPVGFGLMGSGSVNTLFTYEPRFWVKVAPL